MADTLNMPKVTKDVLVARALEKFGGKKTYWTKISKAHLEAALEADPLVQECIASIVSQLSESAKTNQRVNGRRLVAENNAGKFETHYKQELQLRMHIERQYQKVLEKLKKLLEVENSEILKASRTALRLLQQMTQK
ncbi:MAG: hypothetical protein VKK04_00260 [Synechococcales bacterium]|nr:hypothetical protein [Synechococcales bacterium]